jgi:hypothetical protein
MMPKSRMNSGIDVGKRGGFAKYLNHPVKAQGCGEENGAATIV